MTVHCFFKPIAFDAWVWDIQTLKSPLNASEELALYNIEELCAISEMDALKKLLKELKIKFTTNNINWIALDL